MITQTFTLDVSYDPEKTDADSVASALDRLMTTALSTGGILDDYGEMSIGQFFPSDDPIQVDPGRGES